MTAFGVSEALLRGLGKSWALRMAVGRGFGAVRSVSHPTSYLSSKHTVKLYTPAFTRLIFSVCIKAEFLSGAQKGVR